MKINIYSTTEVANYLNVHPTTVKRWISNGELNAYREPGGRWRITEKDFVNFLQKHGIPFSGNLSESSIKNGNKKVLIADDDNYVRKVTHEILKRNFKDIIIEEVEDGINACIQIGKFRPHLVVLDIKMPDMDGVKVAKLIKEDENLASITILAISGYFDDEMKEKLKSFGVEGILEKPFTADQLLDFVKKSLY